jgi:hypothetical protein
MKFEFSKEWFEKSADLEGNCEVGAYNPNFWKEITENIKNSRSMTKEEKESHSKFVEEQIK